MPDYKQLYFTLFRKLSTVIEILQQAQCEAEELFISQSDPDIFLLEQSMDE